MRFNTPFTLAAAAILCAAPTALAQGTIDVGSETSYGFREAPINSLGIKSLKALRGKPVLIEFWGTQ